MAFGTSDLSPGVGPTGLSAIPAGGAASAATVPSSGGSSSTNYQEIVERITKPIDPNLVRAAATPIPGAHVGAVPSSLQRPVTPWQERGMDARRLVGRKASARQGVSNAVTGATNALGQAMATIAQQKQDHVRDAAVKVLTAQQAIDQAKMAQDQATASGDTQAALRYQEMVQKNTQVRDAIFADKKLGPALQKGFDISYTDPSANKTMEHAAVQEALKGVHDQAQKKAIIQQMQEQQARARGTAMGTAFEKSLPQGMAANTIAQAQLQQQIAERKDQIAGIRALAPVWAAQERAGVQLTIAEKKDQTDRLIAAQKHADEVDNRLTQIILHDKDNNTKIAIEKFRASVQRDLKNMEFTNPLKMMEFFSTSTQRYNGEMSAADGRLTQIESTLAKEGVSDESKKELIAERDSINARKKAIEDAHAAEIEYVKAGTGIDLSKFEVKEAAPPKVGEGVAPASTPAQKGPFGQSGATTPTGSTRQGPFASTSQGGTNAASTGTGPFGGSQQSGAADINPYTGKPYAPGTPAIDKFFDRARHARGEANIQFGRLHPQLESLYESFTEGPGFLDKIGERKQSN